MKVFASILFSAAITISLFSCNNSGKETDKKEESTTNPADTNQPAAFKPFDVMVIMHTVKDYAAWRPLFDADSVARKAAGLNLLTVGRSADDPNRLIVVLNIKNVQDAKNFAGDPRLKEIMTKAGVISKPTIEFYNVTRFNSAAPIKQWVTITHKVKDFDAWVKVFDSEGSAQRSSEGFMDLGLARGIDDPNIVHVVLEITDKAKAEKAINSEAKKKLMEGAGVIEQPRIEYYQAAQ